MCPGKKRRLPSSGRKSQLRLRGPRDFGSLIGRPNLLIHCIDTQARLSTISERNRRRRRDLLISPSRRSRLSRETVPTRPRSERDRSLPRLHDLSFPQTRRGPQVDRASRPRANCRIGFAPICHESVGLAETSVPPLKETAAGARTPGHLRIGGWCTRTMRRRATPRSATGGRRSTTSGWWPRMSLLMGGQRPCSIKSPARSQADGVVRRKEAPPRQLGRRSRLVAHSS